MVFQVVHTLGKVVDTFDAINQDSKKALRQTTTQVTFKGRAALKEELKDKLENPVPWIVNSYFAKPATDLEDPTGTIFVKESGNREQFIDSITRTGSHIPNTVTERARASGLLRSGESLVPTYRVRRNAKDNVGKGPYRRFSKYRRVTAEDGRGFYGKGTTGTDTKLFTPATVDKYDPLFDPEKVVDRVAQRNFAPLYEKNYEAAVVKTLGKAVKG